MESEKPAKKPVKVRTWAWHYFCHVCHELVPGLAAISVWEFGIRHFIRVYGGES